MLLGDWRVDASDKAGSGTARALWFFELEKAIDEAQWLAWRIGVVEGRNAKALELYVQLELVRAEVEALRGHNIKRFFDPPPSTAFPSLEDSLDALRNLTASRKGLEE
jgi:hypothetical protein